MVAGLSCRWKGTVKLHSGNIGISIAACVRRQGNDTMPMLRPSMLAAGLPRGALVGGPHDLEQAGS